MVEGATSPAAPASADNSAVGEIVVTAQRREESIQKVPIAITALSGTELAKAGVTSLQNLKVAVPGLSFGDIQGNVTPRLRGAGSSTGGPGIESNIAVYIDGVYYASATGALFSFNNVEQVAVLKGPQGTLFGRNAVDGLIQVTTRKPTEDLTLEAKAGYGNYDTKTGSFYIAHGLAPNLVADFAAQVTFQGDGYGKNLITGHDTQRLDHDLNFRSKIVWDPTPATTVTLIGDFSTYDGTRSTIRLEPGSTPAPGTGPNYGGSVWDTESDPAFEGRNKVTSGGGSLTVRQGIGDYNFLSITAYRRLQYNNTIDLDATASPFQGIYQQQKDRQFSQELQLQSPSSGRFKWTIGTFYFDARSGDDPLLFELPFLPLVDTVIAYNTTRSISGFGQASYEVLPRTTLTLGARYTSEQRILNGTDDSIIGGTLNVGGVVRPGGDPNGLLKPGVGPNNITFNKPTFRASIDHQFDLGLVYASVNTGFKSGGFNAGSIVDPAFRPETNTAYEIGAKMNLLERRLTVDLAGFYYDEKNIQVQKITAASLGIINGAAGYTRGIDIDLIGRPMRGLSLFASAELLQARFTNFANNAPISTFAGGTPVVLGDASGNRIPLAPTFAGNVGVDYQRELANGSTVNFNTTLSHNSGWYTEPDNKIRQHAFELLNATATWTPAGKHYSISVWGRNLTDAEVRSNATTLSFGNHVASFDPPRTYGFTVGYKY